jgi:hypothetical protein
MLLVVKEHDDELPSEEELAVWHCWELGDRVPGRPAMTAFRRRVRYQQARWRDANGHPVGSQPILPAQDGTPPRLVGSRLPLDYGRETGANFVTAGALAAARERTSHVERHQSFDHQRLWADLLSSVALAFNLFGDVGADLDLADRAVHTLWPDAPGTVSAVRFAHSPGRLDPSYIGSLVDFDVAFVLDRGDGTRGVIGIDVEYHEQAQRHRPKPQRLPRYLEVAARSQAFGPAALDAVNGTDLLVMWLEHLLVFSMVQQPSGEWSWGRYVVVHPAGSTDFTDACARYQAVLVDHSTFSTLTAEELVDSAALPVATVAALHDRYAW